VTASAAYKDATHTVRGGSLPLPLTTHHVTCHRVQGLERPNQEQHGLGHGGGGVKQVVSLQRWGWGLSTWAFPPE
jgi:hypothetical protein